MNSFAVTSCISRVAYQTAGFKITSDLRVSRLHLLETLLLSLLNTLNSSIYLKERYNTV